MKSPAKKRVLVLLSGGIDSCACIKYYKEYGLKVDALFIDFGQLSSKKEFTAVKNIAKYYSIKYHVIKVKGFKILSGGNIQGRNLFLISSALMTIKNNYQIIALGIHEGTDYIDCSSQFVFLTNNLLNLYTGGKVILGTPFLDFKKAEIFEYSKLNDVPLGLTYSCELGLKSPCKKCSSCKDLIKLYASQKHTIKPSERN